MGWEYNNATWKILWFEVADYKAECISKGHGGANATYPCLWDLVTHEQLSQSCWHDLNVQGRTQQDIEAAYATIRDYVPKKKQVCVHMCLPVSNSIVGAIMFSMWRVWTHKEYPQ